MALINLQPAYQLAREKLATGDPELMARYGEVDFRDNVFTVPFLGARYQVEYPSGQVRREGAEQAVPLEVAICILHYLTGITPVPVQGKYIAFREIPGAAIYIDPFTKRTINPLVAMFQNRVADLPVVGQKLGGRPVELGDAAVTIPVLPRVPVTYVLWEGDEEFPPSGNVLFDASAAFHLTAEDYVMLASLPVYTMKGLLAAGK
ncbi:DUF3786 domain-containing protein [Desulfurispora thermophila]|uniref:DUF3786 domain-containing protein n=1 Tax=Desulfurispora thermophila TaxID=265470 RepID=UPI00039DA4F7|nr:DUF3786 domain-containing protein [Desulfurispora thermophila]